MLEDGIFRAAGEHTERITVACTAGRTGRPVRIDLTEICGDFTMNSADFSADRKYRYVLRREIGSSARRVVFVMLNPSSADEDRNDPTVRRCVGFARRWGFGALEVVNLFALVSTDPNGLSNVDDPVGPRNDAAIRSALQSAATVVLAWGDKGLRHRDRADAVIAMAREAGTPCCFGMTKEGAPRHPLRLSYKAALTPF